MIWELIKETEKLRVYRNTTTGSETEIEPIYTDNMDQVWWGFKDLFKIPNIRKVYTQTIQDLFGLGLTLKDLKLWFGDFKTLLRSTDPEKYEKLYAKVLEKETIAENTVDPIKQHLALATVYILFPDERIDAFSQTQMNEKLRLWGMDLSATAFFLDWQAQHILNSYEVYKNSSLIVSSIKQTMAGESMKF